MQMFLYRHKGHSELNMINEVAIMHWNIYPKRNEKKNPAMALFIQIWWYFVHTKPSIHTRSSGPETYLDTRSIYFKERQNRIFSHKDVFNDKELWHFLTVKL